MKVHKLQLDHLLKVKGCGGGCTSSLKCYTKQNLSIDFWRFTGLEFTMCAQVQGKDCPQSSKIHEDMDFKSDGHGFQCWSLQIVMSYKVWDSCVIVMMKLVIWAQEEVYSLHLLFLNSKFMLSWSLQPTSLFWCLFWVLRFFMSFVWLL